MFLQLWIIGYLGMMNFIPGQPVIVLDTTHKPAGDGVVLEFNAETERCNVLYQYPVQPRAENIATPAYRLIPHA